MNTAVSKTPLAEAEQLMRCGDFSTALQRIEQVSDEQSSDTTTDALYLKAVCQRYLKRPQQALKTLEQLHRIAPDHSRALQEQGHVYRSTGNLGNALKAYMRATQLNRALEASWRAQIELLTKQGRQHEATAATQALDRIKRAPDVLVSAIDLAAQGKLVKAEQICRAFLQKNPLHLEAMRLLAEIGLKLGVLEDAEYLLQSALELIPQDSEMYTGIQMELLQVLRKRQKHDASLQCAEALLNSAPNNPQFKSLYAIECMQNGDFDTALAYFDSVLASLPEEPITLTSRGHALKTWGKQREAIDSYQRALNSKDSHGEAWYSLANLKTFTFDSAQIIQMQSLVETAYLSHADQVYLHFALGKALEDQADYADSFAHYQAGNDLKKNQSRYDAGKMSEELRRQQTSFTASFARGLDRVGDPAPDPIFIVGLPRAGSTLLEQILSSHSLVDGTLELPNIPALAHRLRRGPRGQLTNQAHYPEVLQQLSAEELRQMGADYIRDTRIHRRQAPYFIDKMPNNFRHIGLIKAILPNARIIDARRSPMGCCFSAYKQLFAEGQEFSYDLTDLGRYYRDYVELMAHWQSVFTDQILQVNYEDVVNNFESQVRQILAYCNLPFEQTCLDFHQTKRAVRTPSSEQVRQPIYRGGLDQWQYFKSSLKPLRETLGELASDTD